jgi:YfiH family protein
LVTWSDCIPIILIDHKKGWIGAIHSGWRGTAANILGKTIDVLKEHQVNPEDVLISIGPGIRDCCYEVSSDFINNFTGQNFLEFFKYKNGSCFFDLSGSVFKQALNSGIKRENIDFYGKCNCCSTDPSFFSFRKDKALFEAQAAFIGKVHL